VTRETNDQFQQAAALALRHLESGRLAEAERAYRALLIVDPRYAVGWNNLGNTLFALGRTEEALVQYRKALELLPTAAEVHGNCGRALASLERNDEAECVFRMALELKPDFAEAHSDLGVLLLSRGLLTEAESQFRIALQLRPGFAEALGNLANTLKVSGRKAEAEACLRSATESTPNSPKLHFELGILLRDRGAADEAQDQLQRALSLNGNYAGARWALAMAKLPVIPDSQAAIERAREAFSAELTALEHWFGAEHVRDGWEAVGTPQPFYLSYHEADNRDLLSRYGTLAGRLMQHWQRAQAPPPVRRTMAKRVRVGIVSAHFTDHSVWNALVKGWVRHLDRERFELSLFALDPRSDSQTEYARSHSDNFESGERSLGRWVRAIGERQPDVLIYPEVGMNSTTIKLAALRLAPMQLAA
jgi:Flp pilus assembly protein TadD